MAFCVKCGQKLNEGDSFCPNCGNKVVKKVVATNENNENQRNNFNVNEKENHPINHQQVIDQAKESFNNLKQQTSNQIQGSPINISINQKFDNSKLIAIFSSIALIISPFLTFVSYDGYFLSKTFTFMSVIDYLSSDASEEGVFLSGTILIILALGALVTILMKNTHLELATGFIAGLFGLYETLIFYFNMESEVTYGIGFYLMLFGSIILIVGVFLDYNNSLKK